MKKSKSVLIIFIGKMIHKTIQKSLEKFVKSYVSMIDYEKLFFLPMTHIAGEVAAQVIPTTAEPTMPNDPTEPHKILYTPEDLERDCNILAGKIGEYMTEKGWDLENEDIVLFPIMNGGFEAARRLSELTNIPLQEGFKISNYDSDHVRFPDGPHFSRGFRPEEMPIGKKIFVVDELQDGGDTMVMAMAALNGRFDDVKVEGVISEEFQADNPNKELGNETVSTVLQYKRANLKEGNPEPDIYGGIIDPNWIVYFWEKEEYKKIKAARLAAGWEEINTQPNAA